MNLLDMFKEFIETISNFSQSTEQEIKIQLPEYLFRRLEMDCKAHTLNPILDSFELRVNGRYATLIVTIDKTLHKAETRA